MARKSRIHLPGGLYHVMLRGNGGQAIFFTNEDREHFETLVADGIERFDHRIHAYCWMGNHVHLAIQVGAVPLSKIMQNLAFRYTRWVNRTQGRTGHLFQGRYRAILVDAQSYLLELVRYIHLNPVRVGLVGTPTDYPWSGHRTYLGLDRHEWLTVDWVLSQFAVRQAPARRLYQVFVAEGVDEGYREDLHRGAEGERLLGDDTFIEKALQATPHEGLKPPTLSRILALVCQRRKLNEAALGSASRNPASVEARALVAYLATESRAATLTEVARVLNRDLATLSRALRHFRERLAREPDLDEEVKGLQKKIMPILQA